MGAPGDGEMRVASFPMYDLPEIRQALFDFWQGLARNLAREGVADVPDRIVHDRPTLELWEDSNLLFSQCCGYDVIRRFQGRLTPVAAPCYDAPGCAGIEYASFVVVREDCSFTDVLEMRDTVAVINGPESHSGMSALRHLVAPRNVAGRFFARVKVSGAHVSSLEMLRRGEADVAAIDCVTFTLLEAYQPRAVLGLRVLGRTYRAPAPPYVTRSEGDEDLPKRVRAALFRTVNQVDLKTARQTLFLKDAIPTSSAIYGKVSAFEDYAIGLGYPKLH